MTIPNFSTLYSEAKSVITSDSELQANDFSDGSWLDAFTAVAATSAQGVIRYSNKLLGRFFRDTIKDEADLDRYILDHFGSEVVRLPGESNADLNARLDDYIANGLTRGTLASVRWMLANRIDGVEPGSTSVEQDTQTGAFMLYFTAAEGEVVADITASILAIVDQWAPGARGINIYGVEAS